jgi:hypothetical protein
MWATRQQMNVLGHEHKAVYAHAVTLPCLLQRLHDRATSPLLGKELHSSVAGESDEVRVPRLLQSDKPRWHGRKLTGWRMENLS